VTVGVLSGNRNFEARINSSITKANYLLTPPLVIAYALAGRIDINFENEPIGFNSNTNEPVYLNQIWANREELLDIEMNAVIPLIYQDIEKNLFVSIHMNQSTLLSFG
jgi:aconitate hydratase